MCYSALIEESYKEYCRQFGLTFDRDGWHDLHDMRLRNPALKIPEGLTNQFTAEKDAFGRSIANLNAEHLAAERIRIELDIAKALAGIAELEAKKPGKTRDKDIATQGRKLAKLTASLDRPPVTGTTYRIYPHYFAAAAAEIDGQRLLTPMRYRVLPRTGVEVPGKYNVFNARRDSLQTIRTWKPLFGRQHGIMPFTRFYEWVERPTGKVEINFSPDGYDGMWAAAVYEECQTEYGLVRSFAMVTDDPPPEVAAAGHDRCPVFLESNLIDRWLQPAGQSLEELDALLSHKEQPFYSHALAA